MRFEFTIVDENDITLNFVIMSAILTKEKKGFGRFREGEEPWQCQVSKGELITKIPKNEIRPIDESGKPAPNYRLYRCEDDAVVVLYAGPLDVCPLVKLELDYLLAVEPPNLRLQEYLKPDGTRKMKMELVCGDAVLFKMNLPSYDGLETFVKGIIRYLGPLEEREGIFFGIEIQVSLATLLYMSGHCMCIVFVSFILIQSLILLLNKS